MWYNEDALNSGKLSPSPARSSGAFLFAKKHCIVLVVTRYSDFIIIERRIEIWQRTEKKKMKNEKAEIAKWIAIGAWATPATGLVDIVRNIVKHLLR